MSMKNTIAHGENFHLYEEFGTKGGLFLRVHKNTVFLDKDMLKGILPALQKLEARNWDLVGEEDVTIEQIDDFINALKNMKAKKTAVDAEFTVQQSTAVFYADLEGDAVPFACNPEHLSPETIASIKRGLKESAEGKVQSLGKFSKYQMEDWQPEDEEEEE